MPSMLVVPGRRYPECPQGRLYDIKDNSGGGEREACTAGCMPKPDRPQLRGVTVSVPGGRRGKEELGEDEGT